jgi:hypothetical protein
MPIRLGSLSLNPIIDADLATGLNAGLLRAVDAESVEIDVDGWRVRTTHVPAIFLLDSIYLAALGAALHGRTRRFSSLVGSLEGAFRPIAPGRLEVECGQRSGSCSVSVFQLVGAAVAALMEVAVFLSQHGYADAATKLILGAVSDPAMRKPPP